MKIENQRGFGFIIVLLSVAAVGLLCLYVAKTWFSPPAAAVDQGTKQVLARQGMDAQSLPGVVQQAQSAVDKANDVLRQKDRDAQKLFESGPGGDEAAPQ